MPDGAPAKVLRWELHRARATSTPFETAWPRAVAIATVRDPSWRQTFTWSRGEWKNCYEKQGRARVNLAALDNPAA